MRAAEPEVDPYAGTIRQRWISRPSVAVAVVAGVHAVVVRLVLAAEIIIRVEVFHADQVCITRPAADAGHRYFTALKHHAVCVEGRETDKVNFVEAASAAATGNRYRTGNRKVADEPLHCIAKEISFWIGVMGAQGPGLEGVRKRIVLLLLNDPDGLICDMVCSMPLLIQLFIIPVPGSPAGKLGFGFVIMGIGIDLIRQNSRMMTCRSVKVWAIYLLVSQRVQHRHSPYHGSILNTIYLPCIQ